VEFSYRVAGSNRDGAPGAVEAEPQGLLWDRERWYLIGRKLGGSAPGSQRFWRADRVAGMRGTTLKAAPSPGFDVRRHLGRRWLGDAMIAWAKSSPVRIRMTVEQAERLGRDWFFGFGQFARTGPDEMTMVYGEVDAAKALELVRWLGPGAELLEPAAWRARLAAEFRALSAVYGR